MNIQGWIKFVSRKTLNRKGSQRLEILIEHFKWNFRWKTPEKNNIKRTKFNQGEQIAACEQNKI